MSFPTRLVVYAALALAGVGAGPRESAVAE